MLKLWVLSTVIVLLLRTLPLTLKQDNYNLHSELSLVSGDNALKRYNRKNNRKI